MPENPRQGFGSRLMQRVLTALDGEIRTDGGGTGIFHEIRLPLRRPPQA